MSVVMAEISKVMSEMRLSYVTIDRHAGLESTLQHQMENLKEKESEQGSLLISSLGNALKGKEEQAQQRVGRLEESVRCLQEDMPVQFSSVDRVNLLEDLVRSIESNYFDMSKEDKELDKGLKGVEGS